MDLSTIMSNIDLHKYMTVKDYLHDVELICNNALEYNPDRDPAGKEQMRKSVLLNTTKGFEDGS